MNTSSGPAPVTTPTAWATELEDAVSAALAAWLGSAPAGLCANPATNQPAISVFGDWPEADVELATPRVVVLRTGEPEVEEIDPIVIGSPVFVEGNIYAYTWLLGHGELPLEIEVWASNKPERGDALARLRAALTASMDVTLAAYFASLPPAAQAELAPHDPVANEIVLQLAAPWAQTLCAYYFEKARLFEGPNAVGDREWRATFRGSASYDITRTTNSPALTSIQAQITAATDAGMTSSPGGPFNATATTGRPTYSR